ncbi:DUF7065 domain-containing protein [Nakamurella lactea]|uniref:DUF7065 domain-containing protein n=1 Tax=Nakamurella lactea TaxID=459515 RepID=UPI00040D75F3|nr:hypothetical protein [Nakamurella lactea]
MTQRIGPEHEGRHLADDDPAYNESSYYNFADAGSGVTGWVRIGLQHNRNAAQAGALFFLPDGRTLFATDNVETSQQDTLAAGPLTLEIAEPHVRQHIRWDGPTSEFTDARALTDPRSAFAAAPRTPVRLDLTCSGRGDSLGADGETNVLEETMARGHYEQFIRVQGTLAVGEDTFAVSGAGLRDHSWGPRDWAGPVRYRWVTAAFADESQLMLLLVNRQDGGTTLEAMEWRDGTLRDVRLEDIADSWTDDGFIEKVTCRIVTDRGPERITATVRDRRQHTPLRHRRPDGAGGELITRIGYGPYSFTRDGSAGAGIVESLDQLIDGRPVSMP